MSRAGPPTPRDEPWKPETPPLPEQPGRTVVGCNPSVRAPAGRAVVISAREAAFQTWAALAICIANPPERAFAKACFDAGWSAGVNQFKNNCVVNVDSPAKIGEYHSTHERELK